MTTMILRRPSALLFAGMAFGSMFMAACGAEHEAESPATATTPVRVNGQTLVVKDTTVSTTFDAS